MSTGPHNQIGMSAMLFAALFAAGVDVNSQEYQSGRMIGVMAAGVGCGLWPLVIGLKKDRPVLGILGFFACIPTAGAAGCLLALPVAFVFRTLIVAIGPPRPARNAGLDDAPYNPYPDGKRSGY